MVATTTGVRSLSHYVISFSFCLLAIRIHAALVAMPFATEYGADTQSQGSVVARSHALTDKVLLWIPLLGMLGFSVLLLLVPAMPGTFAGACIIALASTAAMLSEHIRRVFLITERRKTLLAFDAVSSLLIVAGVWAALMAGMEGEWLLLGFTLSACASLPVYVLIRNRDKNGNGTKPSLRCQVTAQRPLLLNNIAQWATGQSAYFLTAALLSAKEVSVIAILRNLFGPLNLVLLSLEGTLPKSLAAVFSKGGEPRLRAAIAREFLYATLGFGTFSLGVIIFGRDVVALIYGVDIAEPIGVWLLLGFASMYWLAVLSRILMVALRARRDIAGIGVVAMLGLGVFLVFGTVLSSWFGLGGIISAMVLVEVVMFGFFAVRFAKPTASVS